MGYTTRIAPSPTGDMHLGTARTAYFNWLAARSTGGMFYLRIDDTDLKRSDDRFTQDIFDAMAWLGLDYDGLLIQSQRFTVYHNVAQELIYTKQAKRQPDGAIILFPDNFSLNGFDEEACYPMSVWTDEIAGKIPISDNDQDIMKGGIVLIKSDGSPTYHFASVVDDIFLGINYIIRGVDHITNTSRQIAIINAMSKIPNDIGSPMFDCKIPKYAHVGLIMKDGKKLSKRDGAASMLSYKDKGYDPDAMLNFMARLGWGPTVDDKSTSILTRDDMLKLFLDGGNMKSSAANMDPAKLDSFDRKYKARKKSAAYGK